jgi:hypothetical protein
MYIGNRSILLLVVNTVIGLGIPGLMGGSFVYASSKKNIVGGQKILGDAEKIKDATKKGGGRESDKDELHSSHTLESESFIETITFANNCGLVRLVGIEFHENTSETYKETGEANFRNLGAASPDVASATNVYSPEFTLTSGRINDIVKEHGAERYNGSGKKQKTPRKEDKEFGKNKSKKNVSEEDELE